MNTLTKLSLTAIFASVLLANNAIADELTDNIRSAARQSFAELHSQNSQQAKIALHKTVLELVARQSAEQHAEKALLAFQVVDTDAVVTE